MELNIDTGVEEFRVNGRGVLRFNPADPNLYHRFFAAGAELDGYDAALTKALAALDGDEQQRAAAGLALLRWLNGQADPALDQSERWYVAMRLFYPEFAALPQPLWPDATQFLTEFLAAGRREQPRPGPALMDWQQDAPLIAAGISKAAGQDVRTLPYLHWWSFLAWFDAIGEGSFATVVAIRDKLRRGKRLENWELDYYRTHRAVVELRGVESAEEQAEKRRLLELLGG